ncbi:esterase [Metarhizium album ARSEF 1941]|uniref:Esterase n=1 Tax=Metarhizium album (strain ARSEF 1941) TaxID=1081103 RepID=A0A0B2X3E5_METAS|nr:esterase [Metarhizium album ARSEF 1941]KHO00864.1 esterase [Metarhizium album ARSEF 1941]
MRFLGLVFPTLSLCLAVRNISPLPHRGEPSGEQTWTPVWHGQRRPQQQHVLMTPPLASVEEPDIKFPHSPFHQASGFIALGDSYSAGIGTGFNGTENDCRQGLHAYPVLIHGDLNRARGRHDTAAELQFLSCTGSTIGDMLAGADHSQIDGLNATMHADFALLSIGGNDLGFFNIMNSCIFRFYSFYSGTCEDALRNSEEALNGPEFEHYLRLAIMEILDRVQWEKRPSFSITVSGYARFFNEDTQDCDQRSFGVWWRGPKLKRKLRRRMNRMVLSVNDKIKRSITAINADFTEPRVMFVDYDDAFEGHRFCEANVTEPDYSRNETWFFLVGGKDNHRGFQSQLAGPDQGELLSPSSPLIDPDTCLGPAQKSGDWGELALCLMAKAAREDSSLRTSEGAIVAQNSMWYVPTYYGKTFHPMSYSILHNDPTIKVSSKRESKSGTIKLKKPPPKHSKPGNWRDGSVVEDEKKKAANSPATSVASPGPVVNQLDDNARETFATGRPLEDSPDLQQCKHCKKSILKTAAKAHIAQCLKLKKEKAQRKKEAREARERAKEAAREEEARKADEENGDDDSDDDDKKGNVAGKKAGKKPEDEKKGGKKRKADGEPDKGPKAKKKKDEPKAKVPKPKGPVDVERQCGVILPNGQPCARSLTCKSHSMGAKRAVVGRSLPYDMLLAAYQKKNQAKQQKAALDANAPVEDDDDANGPVDSDEETGAVMSALSHWHPQPLIPQPIFTPIKRQYQLSRLHEQLQLATNGGRTNIFHVVGYGAQKLPEGHPGLVEGEDAPGEPDLGALGFPGTARSSNFGAATVSQRRSSVTSRG